jgi:hypothetical protein
MDIALLCAGLAVYAWLLIIVHRQRIREQLPWFVLYVSWGVLAQVTEVVLYVIGRQLYFGAYWWMQGVEIALTVAAVRESFLRIFEGFTRKMGFRLSVWGVIVGVVVYSAWKAVYAPPIQVNRLATFVFGTEFAFSWGLLGIAVLTGVLSALMKEGITREDAVVTGFGAAAATFLLYLGSFSLFGIKYIFLTKYIPAVGYFVAVFWWIYVFSRPVKQFGFKELGMGPEEISKALRLYRDFGERL